MSAKGGHQFNMKRTAYIVSLFLALAILAVFVVYPAIISYMNNDNKKQQIALASTDKIDTSLSVTEWKDKEQIIYSARDYRTLEEEFESIGYPPFQYLEDGAGSYTTKGERSVHEDGMIVELYMDDNYYLKYAKIEYTVPSSRFSSTAMDKNITPFVDFLKIITNHDVSTEQISSLTREYANVFNDKEKENKHQININGLDFTLSIDSFFGSIIMESVPV